MRLMAASPPTYAEPPNHTRTPPHTRRLAGQTLQRLSQNAGMYHVDTGFTNERVPLNDEHYLLPLWMRILVRTTFVCIITIISIVSAGGAGLCVFVGGSAMV